MTIESFPDVRSAGIQPGDDLNFKRSEICTDKSAATVFADMFGPYARWAPEWGWMWWEGSRWKRDSENKVKSMALEVGGHFRRLAMQLHQNQADKDLVKWVLGHARKCESNRGIEDFLRLAQGTLHEPIINFDSDPLLVNFRNATLDFRQLEGDIPKHNDPSRADLLTKVIPHDWHMGASCPRWESFMVEILPDSDVRWFVQKAVGYSLLGTTSQQVCFILWGGGLNGKSTFLNTLMTIIGGGYCQQADPKSFMVSKWDRIRSDLARMQGVRLLSSIETGSGNRIDEPIVKAMTGGDRIVAEYKYKDPFEFIPEFKLWMATNHKPIIQGTDNAIWRRIRLIPFTVTIAADKLDSELDLKLLREAEGILDWCIRGAVAYFQEGLKAPEQVLAVTAEYRESEDILGRFFEANVTCDEQSSEEKGELYGTYKNWCERQGENVVSQRKFSQRVQERGFKQFRGTGGKHNWIGLKIQRSDVSDV